MTTIAILYICTGKYDVFWEPFFTSFEKHFVTDCHKEYFVFTDAKELYRETDPRVHKHYLEPLGWPKATLMRFHSFHQITPQLEAFDYVFFFNANMECNRDVRREEILPPRAAWGKACMRTAFRHVPAPRPLCERL